MWPVGRLIPYERNARTHSDEQITQIAASILKFGFTAPILVDQHDGILAGHGRLKAAVKLGMAEVPVIPLDHLSEAERRAYIIADNKLAENAGWDEAILRGELEQLKTDGFELEVLAFSTKELEAILDDSEDAIQGETDEDEAPALAPEPVSRAGDMWLLGNHRLLVGDARNADDVAAVMQDDKAQLILTDPPYNVDYRGGAELEREPIQGDNLSAQEFQDLLEQSFANYRKYIRLDGSAYIFYPVRNQSSFETTLDQAGFAVRTHLLWVKNHFVFKYNRGRYQQQHEGILYAYVKGESDPWYGDGSQSTTWFEPKATVNREHPTQKPVALLERALINSTRRGDIVMDFFGGAGSTLMACERMGRKARIIEVVPGYVDVTLWRWAAYTKQRPVLASSGSSFMQVERERLLLEKKAARTKAAR